MLPLIALDTDVHALPPGVAQLIHQQLLDSVAVKVTCQFSQQGPDVLAQQDTPPGEEWLTYSFQVITEDVLNTYPLPEDPDDRHTVWFTNFKRVHEQLFVFGDEVIDWCSRELGLLIQDTLTAAGRPAGHVEPHDAILGAGGVRFASASRGTLVDWLAQLPADFLLPAVKSAMAEARRYADERFFRSMAKLQWEVENGTWLQPYETASIADALQQMREENQTVYEQLKFDLELWNWQAMSVAGEPGRPIQRMFVMSVGATMSKRGELMLALTRGDHERPSCEERVAEMKRRRRLGLPFGSG